MHRNPRPGPAGMTYGGPATLPAPDAPVTASAHPASSERPEEDWGRQGTSPRRVDPTHPAPSTMADDAYRDTRMHSAGAKVAAEHDYAAGVAAERARVAAWLRTMTVRRSPVDLAAELEGRVTPREETRVYRLSVAESRAWAKPEMRERIHEAARKAYPTATAIEIRDPDGVPLGVAESKVQP